jgi:hypothetical protein
MRWFVACFAVWLGLVSFGCSGDSDASPPSPDPYAFLTAGPPSDPTAARATLEAAATAGLVPEGIIISTPTPDLREALPPDAAATMLAEDQRLDALLSAVAANDVDGLLALFDWQTRTCGTGGRAGPPCDAGVAPGTEVGTILAGGDTFYVTEATIRRYLARVMSGTTLALRFAGQWRAEPQRLVLGFDGPAKMAGEPPIGSADADVTGVLVTADVRATRPVVHFDLLTTTWGAIDAGLELERNSNGELRIITLAQ